MKLKNKKTGKIGELSVYTDGHVSVDDVASPWSENTIKSYNSLAELNEEWEDYEELKRHWIIDTMNDRVEDFDVPMDFNESIGNYFETKEEAEKAVEELKAWKRLKDKGVEFYGWRRNQTGTYELYMRWEDRIPRSYEIKNDLDLLFGGEE